MQRIFIAIEINEEARQIARQHAVELKRMQGNTRVSWVAADKLHLTLKFFGDVEKTVLERIENAVADTARKINPFQFTIQGAGVFPNKRRPSVLWFGVQDGDGKLEELKTILDERFEQLGFESERRAFRPHLTIARLRQPLSAKTLAEQHIAKAFEPVAVKVNRVVIYESRLESTGAVYLERFSAKLGE